jgi:hypothetical protein
MNLDFDLISRKCYRAPQLGSQLRKGLPVIAEMCLQKTNHRCARTLMWIELPRLLGHDPGDLGAEVRVRDLYRF